MSADYSSAVSDFRRARRQAALEQILARLRRRPVDLLPYKEVRDKLKARASKRFELREIPLDAIVGSVGRYADFTRSFLPRQDEDQERWARVELAVTSLAGVPPIEVYQIGDVYFVRDGNHRVSVARQFGATLIQAYVTEIHSRVPLSPEVQPGDLTLKAEYAGFLDRTRLDELRPGADLTLTARGRYPEILEHIEVHRHYMGLEQQREIPYAEAVGHWYDEVYLPVVQVIRQRGILRDFSERTEADLYLWISKHRAALEEGLGWQIDAESAAADLTTHFSPRPRRVVARVGGRILDAVTPDELEDGPSAGRWREERLASRREDCLFSNILVPVSGEEDSWHALDQALQVARREDARVQGLHVLPAETQVRAEEIQILQAKFHRRCEAAGVSGELALERGKVARTICERALWSDLVVVNLAYPPAPQPLARLGSGFRTLIRRCPRPVLAVPQTVSPLNRALLAFDGSPKAEEALFVATYLASRWQTALTVVGTLENSHVTQEATARAQTYLESHGVQATYVRESGPAAEAILRAAQEHESDLILMGGYGHSAVVEIVLGSTVDQVLRESARPTLICR
jgi:nucleotide-binding universal stress UspA family protein